MKPRLERAIVCLLLPILAVLLAGCAVLTSRHGAVGASWALVIGSAVQVAMSVIVLRRSRARLRQERDAR